MQGTIIDPINISVHLIKIKLHLDILLSNTSGNLDKQKAYKELQEICMGLYIDYNYYHNDISSGDKEKFNEFFSFLENYLISEPSLEIFIKKIDLNLKIFDLFKSEAYKNGILKQIYEKSARIDEIKENAKNPPQKMLKDIIADLNNLKDKLPHQDPYTENVTKIINELESLTSSVSLMKNF